MKKKYVMIFESFDPMFRYLSCYRSEIEVLTSDQRSEVKKWPPRGQNEKIMPYLNFLTPKTYV